MSKKEKPLMAAMPSEPSGPKKDGSEDDYEAKSAMEDISRAQQHMADPDMMKRVHKHVGRKMKALQGIKSIKELKDVAYRVRSGKDDVGGDM